MGVGVRVRVGGKVGVGVRARVRCRGGGVGRLVRGVHVHVALDVRDGVAVLEPLIPHGCNRGLLRQHTWLGVRVGLGRRGEG